MRSFVSSVLHTIVVKNEYLHYYKPRSPITVDSMLKLEMNTTKGKRDLFDSPRTLRRWVGHKNKDNEKGREAHRDGVMFSRDNT